VAARLRRELQADVELVRGHYGEFKLLVDRNTIIDGGAAAFFGVLPSSGEIPF
jgi:coproporphyrinogen III oxidase